MQLDEYLTALRVRTRDVYLGGENIAYSVPPILGSEGQRHYVF